MSKTPELTGIFYHVGQGKSGPWREAVVNVPVGASEEAVSAIADTVKMLDAAFPVPVVSWFTAEFVSAYLAVGQAARLQALLVAMGNKGVFDPGAITLSMGNKHVDWTVAETISKDGSYLDWLGKQDSPEAKRIVIAANAYNVLKPPKSTKAEEN
jgi:hypothetical protein